MSFRNMTGLAGATLCLALSFASAYPALAKSENVVRRAADFTYTGIVRSIVGDIVTLELPDGSTKEIGLNPLQQGRIGLVPGMRLGVLILDGQRLEVAVLPKYDYVATTTSVTRVETVRPVETRRTEVEVTPVETAPPVTAQPEPAPEPAVTSTPEPEQPIRALW